MQERVLSMGDPSHLLGRGHLRPAHLRDGELQGPLLLLDVPSGEAEEEGHVPDGVVAADGLGRLGVDDVAVVVKVDDDVVAWKWRRSLGERDLLWTHTGKGGWRFVSQIPARHGQPNLGCPGGYKTSAGLCGAVGRGQRGAGHLGCTYPSLVGSKDLQSPQLTSLPTSQASHELGEPEMTTASRTASHMLFFYHKYVYFKHLGAI